MNDWLAAMRRGRDSTWDMVAPLGDELGRRVRDAWRSVAARLLAIRRSEPLPSRPVVVVAVCLALGCGVGRLAEWPGGGSFVAGWWAAAVAAVTVWAWALWYGRPRVGEAAVCAAVCFAGAAWSEARFDLFRGDDLAWHLSDSPAPVAITGTVEESFRLLPVAAGDPRRAAAIGPSSECLVRIDAFRSGSRWRPASGSAAVVVDGDPPSVRVGDRIRVLGRGLRPAPALNPGEFDFRLRARAHRCLSIVRVGSRRGIKVLSPTGSLAPAAFIDGLRSRGVAVLEAHVSPQRAPLAAALLLGSRESLPREEADDFLATGTVHILSISGLHVGLLSLALFKLLRLAIVPRGWSLLVVALVTGGYMLLVRAETPVLRATLLVWLSCLAAAVGRRSPAVNALAVAAIVVLIWRPAEVFSAGAQLSFLSTGVLVGVAALLPRSRLPDDPIDRLIERSRTPLERYARGLGWQVWTLFATGAAVWIVTSPLVAARFHIVSPVALLVNVLVAPLVAVAMGSGFLCLATAAVSNTLASLGGAACDGSLAWMTAVVGWAADLPASHVWLPGPPAWWVAGWYLLLAATLLWLPAAALRRARTWAVVTSGWIAVGLVVGVTTWMIAAPPPRMRVVVAAMGHGCGIVVRSPGGRCLVFDAGRLGAPGAARRAMASVLWSEGIARIDTLVVSHADTDHFNAVPELLGRFAVGEVLVPPALLQSESPAVLDLVERVRGHGIPLRTVRGGDAFAIDPLCRVRVLHPDPAESWPAPIPDNQTSLVMAVESAGRRLLLTGDIEGEALAHFIAADPDTCDALVAPHHGSRSSLPPDIAAATAPEVMLVSGLGGPAWPEVRAAYAAASGAKEAAVLKTGGAGAIAIEFTAADVRLAQFAAGSWRPIPQDPPEVAGDGVGSGRIARGLTAGRLSRGGFRPSPTP
jgi:competence protein ComEC